MSIKKRIKHYSFCLQNKSLKSKIQNDVNTYFGHSQYSITFDVREPHHLDTVCFWIKENNNSNKKFFCKFIINPNNQSIEKAGFKIYKGKEFIDKTLEFHTNSRLLNIPEAFKISENIIAFQFLDYPTFKSLYELGHSPFDLIKISIDALRDLHQQNVYHYDPNWENILLDQKSKYIYFIDFDREILANIFSFDKGFFDIFKIYTNLFEINYTRKWATQNKTKIINCYMNLLTTDELITLSKINNEELSIIFPKISKKIELKNAINALINSINESQKVH